MSIMNTMGKIAASLMARDEWAKRKWPMLTVGKIAGGFTTKPRGLLTAYLVNGVAQWSRVYQPRAMTHLDEQRYKNLQTKMRSLGRQMRKLEAGAYERGYPIYIEDVVALTNERENRK